MNNVKREVIFMYCLLVYYDLKIKVGKEVGKKFGFIELEVIDEVFEGK